LLQAKIKRVPRLILAHPVDVQTTNTTIKCQDYNFHMCSVLGNVFIFPPYRY